MAYDEAFTQLKHDDLKSMGVRDLIQPIKDNPNRLALRFASGICGYFLRFSPSRNEFVIVYSGPHGPENRPARADERNIQLLQEECEDIQSISLGETPFSNPELRGN